MTKEEFKDQTTEAREYLNKHFHGDKGIAFALICEAHDEVAQMRYNDIISNVTQSQVMKFIRDILTIATSIIGRQN